MLEQVPVHLIFDLGWHEIVKFCLIHGQFSDQRAWYVDSAGARLQKNRLFLCQTPIDDSHRKLTIKIWEWPHTPHEKVDVVILHEISQKALNSDNFNFVSELARDLA